MPRRRMSLVEHFEHWHDHPPPPFNPLARVSMPIRRQGYRTPKAPVTFAKAVDAAYAAYCELSTTSQEPGPNEERAAAYRRICEELAPQFPTAAERGDLQKAP